MSFEYRDAFGDALDLAIERDKIMEAVRIYGARCLDRGRVTGTPKAADALVAESDAYAIVDELVESAIKREL